MIDIVIPNYNGRAFLSVCLKAIRAQSFRDWRVIVVDNGSEDDSSALLQEHFPEVRLVQLAENTGFSAAVNTGIASGDADLVFLLNNDTELAPDCLEQLARAARQWPEAGFFAARLVNFHERHLLDGAGEGFLRSETGYRLGSSSLSLRSACVRQHSVRQSLEHRN